jgi:hypothetical protein
VAAWQPTRTATTGASLVAAPAPAVIGNVANCPAGTQPATIGDTQVTVCSSDNVF